MNDLNVITVNVRGINSYQKRNKLFSWFAESKFDIIFLQETQLRKILTIGIIIHITGVI